MKSKYVWCLLLVVIGMAGIGYLMTKGVIITSGAGAKKSDAVITWIEDKPGPSMQGKNVFPTVPDSIWEQLGLTDGIPSSMSCFLLEADGECMLIDAGMGAPFSQLLPRLEEKGIPAEDIPLIYITHMHGDHVGGLIRKEILENGAETNVRVFKNAKVYINRVEVEGWLSLGAEKSGLVQAVLEAYSGDIQLFEAGDVLPHDVQTIAAYGHTPGHTCFQKDDILIIGDILHGAALQLEYPEYCPFYDMDAAVATESRLRILQYGRDKNLRMYGHHLPAPGCL